MEGKHSQATSCDILKATPRLYLPLQRLLPKGPVHPPNQELQYLIGPWMGSLLEDGVRDKVDLPCSQLCRVSQVAAQD